MTRCNKSEVNLKSTAYNQNGQNYFEQLTAYNSMSVHLRRVLLAKCAVDAKNKTYMRRRKQTCRQIDWKPRYVKAEIKNNIIDKLAYDTSYHPADFLRMNCDSKYYCQHEAQKYFIDPSYDYDEEISLRSRLHVACPSSSTFKTNCSEPVISNNKNKRQSRFNTNGKKVFNPVGVETAVKIQDRVEKNSMYYESTCDYLSQNINHLSSEINTSRNYGDYETPQICTNLIDSHKTCTDDEETKYAKFMYDITHEIILNGLYTDEELQEVFNKYIEENKTVLDTNRMLYEIYQLKFALNISADTSEEEKLEDLICAQQLLHISEIRPPTPPKILNENRVLEKLTWYQNLDEIRHDSLSRGKSVLLIDANPELHITEKDVLTSLIEADINPEEARKIYKRLSSKSKSLFKQNEEYEVEKNIQFNNSLTESYNVNKVDESKRNSMINDFITQESKDIQI